MKWTTVDDGVLEAESDIEIEEVEVTEEEDESNDNEEQSEESDTESEDENEEEDEEGEGSSKKKRRPSRARKRINRLSGRNKQLESELAKKEKKLAEFEKTLEEVKNSQNTSSLDSKIQTYSTQITNLEKEYATALSDGEHTKASSINTKLNDAILQKRIAESQKQSTKDDVVVDNSNDNTDSEQNLETPEAYSDWVDENDWFEEPQNRAERKLQRQAKKVAQSLAEDGYEVDEDEFYEEMDKELKSYIKKNKLKVEGFEDLVKKDEENEEKDEKKRKNPPAKSSNRTLSMSKNKGKIKVRLTSDQVEMAKRLGLTPEKYAKQLARQQSSEKSGKRYTNVFDE